MSRPLRLVYVAPTFATAGNFPAGANPWNAQPMRVVPAPSYFLPGTVPPAEYMNYLFGNGFDQMDALAANFLSTFDFVSPIQALNWPNTIVRTGGVGTERIMSAFWDTFNARWILTSGLTGGTTSKYINVSSDAGVSYSLLQTLSPTGAGNLLAGVCDPASNNSIICPSAQTFLYVSTTGTAWASQTAPGVVSTYTQALFFKGLFVAIGTGSANTVARLITSPDTAIWTDRTASIPAAIATLPMSQRWAAAASPTILVAIPGSDASNTAYATMHSTDGITWIAGSITNVNIVAGDLPSSIAYSPTDGKFMMTLISGLNTKIMTSVDGLTWTYLRTIVGYNFYSISVLGSAWVAASLRNSTIEEAIYSLDAGLTWSTSPLRLPVDANPPVGGSTVFAVFANTTQFLLASGVAAYTSLNAGPVATF